MFLRSIFDGDISKWDVKNVKDMHDMFYGTIFKQDISSWELRKDCNVAGIFVYCPIKEEYKPKSLQ